MNVRMEKAGEQSNGLLSGAATVVRDKIFCSLSARKQGRQAQMWHWYWGTCSIRVEKERVMRVGVRLREESEAVSEQR